MSRDYHATFAKEVPNGWGGAVSGFGRRGIITLPETLPRA